MKRILTACAIGNIIEWYEFMIFGYFATIIGQLFFPASSSLGSLFKAFGVFAVGILVRPLGGILFGHIGDKYGRKKALLLSLYLMSIPTVMIVFLPGYDSIGMEAPIALILIRILQGISMGGEYAGTMIYLIEDTNPKKRGFYGSIAALSLVVGMALGSLVSTVLHVFLAPEQLSSWGWRLPFIISIGGFLWGLYIRSKLEDSGVFTELKLKNSLSKLPIKETFQKHSKQIFSTVFVQCFLGVGMYTMTIFYANFAKEHFGSSDPLISLMLNTPGVLAIGVAAVISGKLSDVYGRKNVLLVSSICTCFAAYFLIPLIHDKQAGSFFVHHMILSLLTGSFLGPIPSFLAECFPAKIRYTCVALSNNLSMGIFGGTAPMMITYLISRFQDSAMPNYYLMASALISVFGLYFMSDKNFGERNENAN